MTLLIWQFPIPWDLMSKAKECTLGYQKRKKDILPGNVESCEFIPILPVFLSGIVEILWIHSNTYIQAQATKGSKEPHLTCGYFVMVKNKKLAAISAIIYVMPQNATTCDNDSFIWSICNQINWLHSQWLVWFKFVEITWSQRTKEICSCHRNKLGYSEILKPCPYEEQKERLDMSI